MIKPTWLSLYPNETVSYGFDATGLWFLGDADGQSYPVRTNFTIPENANAVITFSFIHSDCADQGVAIFTGDEPMWDWGPESSRIAYEFNCGVPTLEGNEGQDNEAEFELEEGQTYTGRMTYTPGTSTVLGELWLGSVASGDPLVSISIEANLGDGSYRVGFDADNDPGEEGPDVRPKVYFTKLAVNGHTTTNVIRSCDAAACPTTRGHNCLVRQGCTCQTWRYFFPQCTRANIVAGNCNGKSGAYVPAITVCNQRLF